jgi:hypothetical protein
MLKEQARVGLKVIFGRGHGEKTLGKIVSVNEKRASVETLEERGTKRSHAPGARYGVPYSMMEPAPGEALRGGAVAPDVPMTPITPRPAAKLVYNPFQPRADQLILEAMACIYADLSPENLSCDGELPTAQVRAKYATLQRQLKGLQAAFGRNVTEEETWAWETSREEYLKTHPGHERLMS